jgi:hypothetical protein
MKIKIDAFAGTRPKVSSRLLGNEDATVAVNCRLYDGQLKGFKEPVLVDEGEILTNVMLSQVGIEVVSFGSYIEISQAGIDVVSRKNPTADALQVGADVVSAVASAVQVTQVGVDVVSQDPFITLFSGVVTADFQNVGDTVFRGYHNFAGRGSIDNPDTSDGREVRVVDVFEDAGGDPIDYTSTLGVSGFDSDPGASWFDVITIDGIDYNRADATYSWVGGGSGYATWNFDDTNFGLPFDTPVNVTIKRAVS